MIYKSIVRRREGLSISKLDLLEVVRSTSACSYVKWDKWDWDI